MKASDLFVKCLEKEGIEYIYGVPGEENADFVMSLKKSKKVKFILTRHEQGGAFMAEIYGRLTGNPAGCLGTLGPGATNLITGVADSNMDRAPMLVLTGQGETQRLHKESHQVMDVVAMFRPVTKWAQTVWHADNIPEIVRKAVRISRTEKPGATLIELPEDIAHAQTSAKPLPVRKFRRPVPDDKIVDKAWKEILKAKKPIILAGNGCIRRRASTQLREFAAKTGIAVISTMMAKGCVDMDDDTCLYTVGLQAKDYPVHAIEQSDLVISLGYDMVEYHPRLWNEGSKHKIVHADFIPAEIDQDYQIDVEVVGDLAHTLWMLNQRADAHGVDNLSFDHRHTRNARKLMKKDLWRYANDKAKGRIKPQKVLNDIRAVMGPDDIVLTDVGAHKMWTARYYQCHEPNTCLIPNGFCSMGFSLPGAFAAAQVYPDRNVIGIAGDAAFFMNVQEMETAARYNMNFTMCVWEDCEYGLIKWKQQNQFKGEHTDLAFTNPDWMPFAKSLGWNAYTCDDSTKLQATLKRSLKADGPSLVVVPIDYRENMKLTKRMGNISIAM